MQFAGIASAEETILLQTLEREIEEQRSLDLQRQRVLGLNQGEIWMSEDFNDPLPDELCMGEQ